LPDCSVLPCIALTFDDGPDRRITPQVLDMLAREGIKATFFLVGREVPGKEDLVRRIYAEGHEIGNHTYNHPRLTQLSGEAIEAEVAATQAAIARAGVPLPEIMRPPYGDVSPLVRAHVQLPMIRWDVDTEDWKTRDAVLIYQHLLQYAHPGAVMLLHDTHQSTVDALGPALQALRAQYQFVTVSQLLGVSAGDQGQYFSRTP
jgi:peptidoglycan/xylan/chitin deacetylase (PgdA/CDA1 family)